MTITATDPTLIGFDSDEIDELTGQRWVPVLVHGDEVIHDSRRILEYIDWVESSCPAA